MFEIVIEEVLVVSSHSHLPLLQLANKPFPVFLAHPGNVAFSSRVLQTNHITCLAPKLLQHYFEKIVEFEKIVNLLLHVIVEVFGPLVLPFECLSNLFHQLVNKHQRQVGHCHVCPVEAVDAIYPEDSLLHFLNG